jgi:hypothetical protein
MQNIYWYMLDLGNYQLITSQICIPGDIKDTKDIGLSEIAIPGLNFQPVTYGGGGNRKISFSIPVINRNSALGNLNTLKMFESLRNQTTGVTKLFNGQFTPNPKVLFQWGTASTPQEYYVKKCDFMHKEGWINAAGFPTYTTVEMELILDESSPLYAMEEIYRKASAVAGTGLTIASFMKKSKPL